MQKLYLFISHKKHIYCKTCCISLIKLVNAKFVTHIKTLVRTHESTYHARIDHFHALKKTISGKHKTKNINYEKKKEEK